MKTMRLLIANEPSVYGAFAIIDDLIRQILAEHPEIQVDLAYSSKRSGEALRDLIREIERHGGECLDLKVGNAPSLGDLAAFLKLIRFTRRRKHDLVYCQKSKAGALARIARLIVPYPPVIYGTQGYYGMGDRAGITSMFYNTVETLLGRVGVTINCSEDEQDFGVHHLHIPPSNLVVIHNGIDTARFDPSTHEERTAARELLGLPARGKLLVTVGRESEQKNLDPLYEVLDVMLPDDDWTFAHAGEGSGKLRASLSSRAAAKCFAFEYLDDLVPLLHAADGFVMTSRYEGLSIAMMDALSCGLTCFLPDTWGFRFLRNYRFNDVIWLPNPDSPAELKKGLRSSLAAWAAEPPGVLEVQHEQACRIFNQHDQQEKTIAFFKSYAGGQKYPR